MLPERSRIISAAALRVAERAARRARRRTARAMARSIGASAASLRAGQLGQALHGLHDAPDGRRGVAAVARGEPFADERLEPVDAGGGARAEDDLQLADAREERLERLGKLDQVRVRRGGAVASSSAIARDASRRASRRARRITTMLYVIIGHDAPDGAAEAARRPSRASGAPAAALRGGSREAGRARSSTAPAASSSSRPTRWPRSGRWWRAIPT